MESGALPGAGDPGLGGGRGPRPRCSGAAFDAAACAFLCGLAVAVLAFVRGCAGATCRSTLMAGATNSRIHVSRPPRPAPLVPRPAPAPRRPSPTVVSAAVDPSALPPAPSPATQAARAFFYGELYPSLDPSRAAALAEADAAAHVEGLGEGEHLYGEVTFDSLAGLLRAVAPEPGAVFLDLGSGCGRAVFTAALTQPFRECRGVELLPSLFEESTKALRIYNAKVSQVLPARRVPKVSLALEDMRWSEAWLDADVVYSFATAFSQSTVQQLVMRLEDLKPGARVMMVSKRLESPVLQEVGVHWLDMADSGESFPCFLYRRL